MSNAEAGSNDRRYVCKQTPNLHKAKTSKPSESVYFLQIVTNIASQGCPSCNDLHMSSIALEMSKMKESILLVL